MSVLFVNACLRSDSRTKILADEVLSHIKQKSIAEAAKTAEIEEVNLAQNPVLPLSTASLQQRNELLRNKKLDDTAFANARQFAAADEIIIAAPFWDLSFPAALKAYIEDINISGITFKYTGSGEIKGLCKAHRLIYVTTAGGAIPEENCGFGYIKSLCEHLYGIKNLVFIKAEWMDIWGADIGDILRKSKQNIPALLDSPQE